MTIQPLIYLLQCPNCSSVALKYAKDKITCSSCQRAFLIDSVGIINFVAGESKNSEIFNYYQKEYIEKHPDLDVQNSAWKAVEVLKLTGEEGLRPKSVLEIGCGGGEVLNTVARELKVDLAVGVDISAAHLKIAQSRNPQLNFIQASAEHLPFQQQSFDLGLMVDLLEHVENVDLVLSEAARVCQYLVLKVPLEVCLEGWLIRKVLPDWRERFGHINFFSQNSLRRQIKQSKLEIVKEKMVWPPWRLLGFSEAGLRAKGLILVRYSFRLAGKRIYSYFFPVWYTGLLKVEG